MLWSLWSLVRNKPPVAAFWTLLGWLQVVVGIQVVVGAALFLLGFRPQSNGTVWLHYAYGGLFPIALLVTAHRYAKKYEDLGFVVFGLASFLICALTIRALMTGFGAD